jgi:hypothetical protein
LASEYTSRTKDEIPVDDIVDYADDEEEGLIEAIADAIFSMLKVEVKHTAGDPCDHCSQGILCRSVFMDLCG